MAAAKTTPARKSTAKAPARKAPAKATAKAPAKKATTSTQTANKAHAALVKSVADLEAAREALAAAMAGRQAAMNAARAAGLKVVEIQAVCGFSSSGATLFAMNGGK
jgi:hypothetical protein